MTKYEVTPKVGAGFPQPKAYVVEADGEVELISLLRARRRPSDPSVAWDRDGSIHDYYTWRAVEG